MHKINIYNVAALLSLITAVLTLVFQTADYRRNGIGSFRRVIGGLIVLFGCSVSLVAWLWLSSHSRVSAIPESLKVSFAVAGAVLVLVGVLVTVRAPLNQTEQTLRILARAAYDSLDRNADTQNLYEHPLVRREVIPNGSVVRKSLKRTLLRRRNKLIILYGEPGTGKTTALRNLTRGINERAMRRRRPRLLALYIDLAILPLPSPTLTTDQIRSYIRATIAGDDSALLSRMELVFRDAPDIPRWIFLFDSIDDLLPEQESNGDRSIELQYLSMVDRFLETGISFYAVAATKYSDFGPALPDAVTTLAPLSREQQRRLIRHSGLTLQARGVIRYWLIRNPEIAILARNPMLLTLFCDAFRSIGLTNVPTQFYEIINIAIETRLISSSGGSLSDEMHEAIEKVVYSLAATGSEPQSVLAAVTEASESQDPTATGLFDKALALLRNTEIVKYNPSKEITFAHQVFRDHFAAKLLMKVQGSIDTFALFTDPSWEEPVTTCLIVGPELIRQDILMKAARLLEDEQRKATGLFTDASLFLTGEETRLTPVSFEWPTNVLRALRIIASGLDEPEEGVPGPIREIANSFVISSFLSGTRREQLQAINVIGTASSQVSVRVMERVASSKSSELKYAASRQLTKLPVVYQRLRIKTRSLLTCTALLKSDIVDYALSRFRIPSQRRGLPAALGNALRVMWWSAIIMLGWFGGELALDALKHHELSAAATISVLIAVFFLIAWGREQRRIDYGFAMAAASLMGVFFIIVWLIGISYLVAALGDFITLRFTASISELIGAYVFTWPIMMIGSVLISTPSTRLDWLMPYQQLIQTAAEQLHWNRLSRGISSIVSPLLVLIAILASWAIAAYFPLARMPKHEANDIRNAIGWGLGSVLLVGMYAAFRCRRWARVKHARRQIIGGSVRAQDVLNLLQAAETRTATTRLLNDMSNLPPRSLQLARTAFRDLARALSHVEDFVPQDTTTRIPLAVWTAAPEFAVPDFKEWLVDFDLQHPGRLSWLSRSHQDDIVGMLSRLDAASRQGYLI